MPKNKNIIALIPARGGSKSIPKKNIIDLGGFPFIAYSIAAAKMSNFISRIIVSTDSQEIAEISKSYRTDKKGIALRNVHDCSLNLPARMYQKPRKNLALR